MGPVLGALIFPTILSQTLLLYTYTHTHTQSNISNMIKKQSWKKQSMVKQSEMSNPHDH
jgi:hypothetical protein